MLAMELAGYPSTAWVQDTDPAGKPLFKMRNKLDAKRKPIKDKYGNVKRVRSRDEHGKFIPVMKQVRVFDGTGGVLGYLRFLAQEHPGCFLSLVCRVLQLNPLIRIPTEADQQNEKAATPEALRTELERRGFPPDYFLDKMQAIRRRAAKNVSNGNEDGEKKKNALNGDEDGEDNQYSNEDEDREADRYH